VGAILVDEQGRVRNQGNKSNLFDVCGKPLIPSTRSLLQAIKRLLQKANMIMKGWINKTWRLLAVDCLIKMTMKKSILDIQLMNRPMTRGCNTQNCPDCSWFNNRTESLIIVNAMLLRKSPNHPTSFVTSKRTIRMILMLENPLSCHDISTRRPRNKTPSTIVNQGLKLICHSCSPIRISKRTALIARNRGGNDMISRQVSIIDRLYGT